MGGGGIVVGRFSFLAMLNSAKCGGFLFLSLLKAWPFCTLEGLSEHAWIHFLPILHLH